jgi:starvation-inducible DNA-binding protein
MSPHHPDRTFRPAELEPGSHEPFRGPRDRHEAGHRPQDGHPRQEAAHRPEDGHSRRGPPVLNPTRNDLPVRTREQVARLLQGRLLDAVDLYLHAKNSHWNVKGRTFIALHELFDKVASEAEGYADLLAERAVQVGGTPDGSASAVAAESTLRFEPASFPEESEHVRAVADALSMFGIAVRAGIDRCTELGDLGTADLFTEITRGVDKLTWFVESHLVER